jgi:uncharacterized protein (DUF2062 family)
MSRTVKPLLVIPVYNHGTTLAEVVRGALATGHEVLVVDDGSDDDCLATLASLQCRRLRLNRNEGKGAAILQGARFAARHGYEVMITIDADGQHDPADITGLIREAEKIAAPCLILGARRMTQETVPRSSHFGKHFSNFWVRLECGCDLADTQTGFRLYPVNQLLDLKLTRTRYDFEIESLVKLAWAGVTISSAEVGVHYPPADQRISHFHKFKDNLRLSLLHGRLVIRRLMPWPHVQLVPQGSLPKTIKDNLQKNPLKILAKVCREHTSPLWLAMAVWLGIFMGALPLLACHTVAILYVAHRLHLNKIAAVAASQFCMPPVVPVLCIQAGYFLRNGEFLLDLSWQRWLLEIHERLWEWFLGSLIVGPILGLAGAFIIYWPALRIHVQRNLKSTSNP